MMATTKDSASNSTPHQWKPMGSGGTPGSVSDHREVPDHSKTYSIPTTTNPSPNGDAGVSLAPVIQQVLDKPRTL
jgi:hypothetical protein